MTRIRRGLSQAQLAHLCGLSQSAISSYENDSRKSPKKLLTLAHVLGVDIYWLSNGGEAMQTPGHISSIMCEPATPWPFPAIEPHLFWALKPNERQAIESAVAALITSFTPRRH